MITTKPCLSCGVWTCNGCGWKRPSAALARPELQDCSHCGGTEGSMRPTRHSHTRWVLCNHDAQSWDETELEWERAPS